MIPLHEYLSVPGDPVRVVERARDDGLPLWRRLEELAPWLRVERLRDGTHPRRTELHGSRPHGPIAFVGDLEQRLLEPLVEALRTLATGQFDWETPATAERLRAGGPWELAVVVGPNCPFCPRVAATALRFACASPRVAVEILRSDSGLAPAQVTAIPTVLVAGKVVATGAIGEYALAEQVLERGSESWNGPRRYEPPHR